MVTRTYIRECKTCHRRLPLENFSKSKTSINNHLRHCKTCMRPRLKESFKKYLKKDPRRRLLFTSYVSARARKLIHTIKITDIELPTHCPYLGIELDYRSPVERGSGRGSKRADNTPSIDRIDHLLGYVPGNIQVISWLANRLKSNASVETLIAFARGILKIHGN